MRILALPLLISLQACTAIDNFYGWHVGNRADAAADAADAGDAAPDLATLLLLRDDFSDPALAQWSQHDGTWMVDVDHLHGTESAQNTYAYLYRDANWTDYTITARFQFPSGSWGGGLGGRLDPATGTHYQAWIYPAGFSGSTTTLYLKKFHDWTTWSSTHTPLEQVTVPVGTDWHTLTMSFQGNQITVYYDGAFAFSHVDQNDEGIPAFSSGGVNIGLFTGTTPYTMSVDDLAVTQP